jgi:hypothetical protein
MIISGTKVIRVNTVSKVIISTERVNSVIRDIWIAGFVSNLRVLGLLGLKGF